MNTQSNEPHPGGRISEAGAGVGTSDSTAVQERARELARIDGRQEPGPGDLQAAREELLGQAEPTLAPEVDSPEVEQIVEWDTPPSATAPAKEMEDEETIATSLVEEGIAEADHDVRLAAADEMEREDRATS